MTNANIRALKLNLSLNRKWLPAVILSNFFGAFQPYFGIILSSLILDEIYFGVPDVKYFVILLSVLLCGSFIIAMLSQLLSNAYGRESQIQGKNHDRYVGDMYMRCAYSTLESEEFTRLRRTIDENERLNGGGRNLLIRVFQSIISDIISLCIAVYFIVELVVKLVMNHFNALTLIFVVLMAALAVVNVNLAKSAQRKEMEMSQKIGDVMNDESRYDRAVDSYQMGKDVRLYGLDRMILNFKKVYLMDDHVKFFKWFMDNNFKNSISVEISATLLKLSIYAFIFINIASGALPVGSIIKYVGLVEMVVFSIRNLIMDVSAIKDNTPCVEAYMKQFDYAEAGADTGSEINFPAESGYVIEFENVSFKYDGSDAWALRNVSLKLEDKQCYALVGENGSGKTTLIKLLCRLYKPTEGRILINGTDIWEYYMNDYIKLLSTVFQDFKLFAFTLGENIALSSEYDSEKVSECIQSVNLEGRYVNMKNGLQTSLYKDFDDEGVEISGGEGQKIALARALYKNSEFMIFDEPTAALDPRSESEIYSMMRRALDKHTTVFVSHRLSSCRFSDTIYVLHQGELVESGNHEALLAIPNGKYSELWNAQAKMYV